MRRLLTAALGLPLALSLSPAGAATQPQPGSPAYQQRDAQNIADAYGRQTGPNGQLSNPAYLPALIARNTYTSIAQAREQAATPNRIAVSPGNLFPGWNVGN